MTKRTTSQPAAPALRTPEQARAWMLAQGLSTAEWARQHGFGVALTRQVLAGSKRCLRGQSHQIAVLLGLKAGVITRSPEEARQAGPHTRRTKAAPGAAI